MISRGPFPAKQFCDSMKSLRLRKILNLRVHLVCVCKLLDTLHEVKCYAAVKLYIYRLKTKHFPAVYALKFKYIVFFTFSIA